MRVATHLLVLVMITIIGLTGCRKEDEFKPIEPAIPDPIALRFFHAIPGAGEVSISIDGATVGGNLAYNTASGVQQYPVGKKNIQVSLGGTVIINDSLDLSSEQGGNRYTAFVVRSTADSASSPRLLVLSDNPTLASGTGNTFVRIVHLSRNAPRLDVTPVGNVQIVNSLGYGQESPWVRLPAGNYYLQALVAGTETIALGIPNVALQNNKVYTFVATGVIGSAGTPLNFQQLVADADGATAVPIEDAQGRAMVVQTYSDANYEIFIDNNRRDSIGGNANTGYEVAPVGTRSIKLRALRANNVRDSIQLSQSFSANQAQTLFITKGINNRDTVVSLTDDLSNPTGSRARIRFVHLSRVIPTVDSITLLNQSALVRNLAFTGNQSTNVDAGTRSLGIYAGGNPAPALIVTGTFMSGKIYTVYVRGAVDTANSPAAVGVSVGVIVNNDDITATTTVVPPRGTRLTVVHATPGIGTIGVSASSQTISGALQFATVTQYVAQTSGESPISVSSPTASFPTLSLGTANFLANRSYTVLISGNVGNVGQPVIRRAVAALDTTVLPAAGNAFLRFGNMIPNIAASRVVNNTNTTVIPNVSSTNISAYTTVPTGTALRFINNADGRAIPMSTAADTIWTVPATGARVYTVILTGTVANDSATIRRVLVQNR
jgi:hypothetical protein